MAGLVKMKHDGSIDSQSGSIIHVKDELSPCGEYTICGIAFVDVSLDREGFELESEFDGPISECTCDKCLTHLNYYKQLK